MRSLWDHVQINFAGEFLTLLNDFAMVVSQAFMGCFIYRGIRTF